MLAIENDPKKRYLQPPSDGSDSPVSPILRIPSAKMTDLLSPKSTDVFDLVSILSQTRSTRDTLPSKTSSLNTFDQEKSSRLQPSSRSDLPKAKKALSEAEIDNNLRCRFSFPACQDQDQNPDVGNMRASENGKMFSSKDRSLSQKVRREEMKELLEFCRKSKREEPKKENIGMFETFSMKKFKEFMANKRL